jgi:hypothetical protein
MGLSRMPGPLTSDEAQDEHWRKPKAGYALRLRNVSHHTQRK